MNEDWLQKIRDRMSDYETDAPPGMWEAIEKRMAATPASRRRARRRAAMLGIRRTMATAAMLALAFTLCLFLLDDPTGADLQPILSADIPAASYPQQPCAPSDTDGRQVQSDQASRPALTATPPVEILAETILQAPEPGDTSRTDHDALSTALHATAENDSTPTHTVARPRTSSPLPVSSGIADKRRNTSSSARNLSIAMFSSGATGAMSARRSPAYFSGAPTGVDYASWHDTPMLGLMLFNKGRRLDTKIRHNIPVRAGITVDYAVSRRISLESGISYAYLSSDITEGSDNNYYEGRQRLHYIGIPLNVRYSIMSWGRIGLYASAGVLAEKCVSARIEKHFIFDHIPNGTTTKSLSERPLQWSVNIGAGLQCRLAGTARLFVEPGVSYYFNDGTKIPTVYSDKPLNFNLNLGVRFTLGE